MNKNVSLAPEVNAFKFHAPRQYVAGNPICTHHKKDHDFQLLREGKKATVFVFV